MIRFTLDLGSGTKIHINLVVKGDLEDLLEWKNIKP